MAISWHWAFGPETITALQNDYGFTINSTISVSPVSAAANVYSYGGSPTRYSLGCLSTRTLTLPAASAPTTNQGWVAIACKNLAGEGNALNPAQDLIRITSANVGNQIRIEAGGGGKALNLYVDNVFKESTIPFDWDDWHYVALQFDFTVDPWSGRIYVDGVAQTALQTDARPADTVDTIVLQGASELSDTWLIGQVICYDSTADAGEIRRFVTRVEPNADGTDIGTWTPSVGGTDFGVLATPLDIATYTENAGPPSPLDRVEVLTTGGGSDLDTALGTTTTAIDSVMVHGYSRGQIITARALVGDGTASETAGPTEAISAGSTSYTYAVANLKPSGGAWTGTDAPEYIYEVVTT